MPNTGEITPQEQTGISSNGNLTLDNDDSTSASIIDNAADPVNIIFSDFDGTDPPAGSTINGVEIKLLTQYSSVFNATKVSAITVSLDGASGTFSTLSGGFSGQNLTTSKTDYDFGGDDELWGLNWSGWTDLSDLAVTISLQQQEGTALSLTFIYDIDAIVYYTAPIGTFETKLKSGKLSLKSGKLTIK